MLPFLLTQAAPLSKPALLSALYASSSYQRLRACSWTPLSSFSEQCNNGGLSTSALHPHPAWQHVHGFGSSSINHPLAATHVRTLTVQSDTPPTTASEACAPHHGHLHAFVEPLLDVYEGVSVLTLNRPSARNAIGKQMLQEVRECIDNLRQEPSTRCVLVRSLASGVFCAGADLKERRAMSVLETAEFVGCLRNTFTALRELPMPTIAVLEGLALGGGAELTLACDLRVGGRDAVLGFPETQLGIIPGAGGTQSLPRLIGVSRAKDLIFTGRRVHAEEALTIGLLDFVVDPGKAYARALQLAGEVCRGGPLALRAAKSALNGGLDVDLHTGLRLEESCYAQLLHSKDRAEGLASFEAKRPPRFTGN